MLAPMNKPICPPISPEEKEGEAEWTWNQSRILFVTDATERQNTYYKNFSTASSFILNNQKTEDR